MKNIAIITGASSGLGAEFVKLIEKESNVDEMWLVSRSAGKNKSESDDAAPCKLVRCFPLDLSKNESIAVMKDALEEECGKGDFTVTYLVNSAGFGAFGSSEEIGLSVERNMIDLNVSALVSMCSICIPYLKNGSRVINIASQASFQPLPYLNVYAATKAFVKNYSIALSSELKKRGATVTAVCPGWMRTPFIDRGEIGAKNTITNFSGATTADKVARKSFIDAKKGKVKSMYGGFVKMCNLASKFSSEKFAMRLWLKMQHLG